ncbi:MAG: hypothetical protein H8E90_02030 [Anaerolineales bacterium]|nr:hypothetical protein [Anaerolineales bacterium]
MEKIADQMIGLIFLAGLLLGWIVIGWWLWPLKWIDTDPWDLRPEHQRRFVELVAEDYGHTKDVSRAKEALAGWDDEALADLLATVQDQAPSPEVRQRLAALAAALELPESEAPASTKGALFSTSLLRRQSELIIGSTALAALVLVLAIVFGISRRPREASMEQAQRAQQAQAGSRPNQFSTTLQTSRDRDETTMPTTPIFGGEKSRGEEPIEGKSGIAVRNNYAWEVNPLSGKSQMEPFHEALRSERGSGQQKIQVQVQEEKVQEEVKVKSTLLDIFKSEKTEDLYLQTISEILEDIDILDLSEECKEVVDQLGGNSLVSELIRERG